MADILNSALTGDADFAGTIFGGKNQEPAVEANETPAVETQEPVEQPTAEAPKEEAPQEEKKAPIKAEPKTEKKPKATKEETVKAVEEITKKSSTEGATVESEVKSEDPSEDLPVNPHFQDKEVADKPEGDDSEKGISSWKEIKSEMKKAREERDRLKAELEATKEKVGQYEGNEIKTLQEQLEASRTQITQLEVELQKANMTRHPRYRREVSEPLEGLQGDLKAIADANDADYSKLWSALVEPDARKRADALEDLTADFKRMEQLSIVKMADKYQDLARAHAQWEEESHRFAESDAAEKAQKEQEFIENDRRLQKAFTAKTWTNLEDRYDFLKEVEGQDDWNNHIRAAKRNAAETDLDKLKVEDRSAILVRAAAVPFLESAINHYSAQLQKVSETKDAEIKELKSQLEGLVGATPSLGKATETDVSEDDEDADSLMNFGKSIFR